ncbi:hypothetical protein ACHHYP_04472 [Achlya hypogyna]|uniref:Uncharacterized protein n=1 Tax=Achlya hypogyna TaxID=1202772 RepID=A0A1V9Z148_ACHHY|nr:hypothetical protein ACHHYP_04472 [Achlya hypogyna]
MNLRSGMSVQDLKQLTAQRVRMEQRSSASSSPSSKSSAFSSGVHVSSPGSMRSFSLSETSSNASPAESPEASPQRTPSPPPPMYLPPAGYPHYASPYRSPAEQRMLVTCGGQVVSLMEGVRNVPVECCLRL